MTTDHPTPQPAPGGPLAPMPDRWGEYAAAAFLRDYHRDRGEHAKAAEAEAELRRLGTEDAAATRAALVQLRDDAAGGTP